MVYTENLPFSDDGYDITPGGFGVDPTDSSRRGLKPLTSELDLSFVIPSLPRESEKL